MLSNSSINGDSKFYTSNIRLAPEDVKYQQKKRSLKIIKCFGYASQKMVI